MGRQGTLARQDPLQPRGSWYVADTDPVPCRCTQASTSAREHSASGEGLLLLARLRELVSTSTANERTEGHYGSSDRDVTHAARTIRC